MSVKIDANFVFNGGEGWFTTLNFQKFFFLLSYPLGTQ